MARLVYAHDGRSVYDELFLRSLRKSYELYLLTFHPSPSSVPFGVKLVKMFDLIPEIPLHPFEGIRMYSLAPFRALAFKRSVSKIKPDAVIGCWAITYGFYAATSDLHPFILFVWGSDVLVYPKKYAPLGIFAAYALRRADVVVVDSEIQKLAVMKFGCAREKIIKFPWVDLKEIKNNIKQKTETRRKLGLGEDDVLIISLRTHSPIYGVNYLIEAIPSVVRQERKAKFLILGSGELTSKFKEQVIKSKLENSVIFLGNVPHKDVTKYLNISDIYVSTSLSDGTSASLLEAMACSLPSVVTDIPGNREWIQDELNGFLIPTKNSGLLAEKIVELIKNQRLRGEMGRKALETVKTKVNWKRNIENLDATIKTMIHHKSELLS